MGTTTQRRKVSASKSKKAVHRVSVGRIPFNKGEIITRTEVSRKVKNRLLTKSTKVVVPVAPSNPLDPSPLLPSDQDAPPTPSKPTRKGPSRSAAVRLLPPFSLSNRTNVYLDTTGAMASIQGGIFRQVHQARSILPWRQTLSVSDLWRQQRIVPLPGLFLLRPMLSTLYHPSTRPQCSAQTSGKFSHIYSVLISHFPSSEVGRVVLHPHISL